MIDIYHERLKLFLARSYPQSSSQPISGDASLRRYFRVKLASKKTVVAAVYPLPFERHNQSFLLATDFFRKSGLPVPGIVETSGPDGIILQEDFGDLKLSSWLEQANDQQKDLMIKSSIELIVKIQAATKQGEKENHLVIKQSFDFDKLFWELEYFLVHFLCYHQQARLNAQVTKNLYQEMTSLAQWLACRPRTLVHRDYHGANLMVLKTQPWIKLGLIDYQDARLGPATYDLAPLLVERLTKSLAVNQIENYLVYFNTTREKSGLSQISYQELKSEFWLMDLQRALKVLGTFGFMTKIARRSEYQSFIPGTIQEAKRALAEQNSFSFPTIQKILEDLSK